MFRQVIRAWGKPKRYLLNARVYLGVTRVTRITTASFLAYSQHPRSRKRQRKRLRRSVLVDLDDVRYTQQSINDVFSDGRPVRNMIADLLQDNLWVMEVPVIRVVQDEGVYWSLDNRRLYAFKQAGLESIPAQIIPATREYYLKRQTKTNGLSVSCPWNR